MLDLLVRGGTVVDGSGRPGFRADVGVSGGRVVAIGHLEGSDAARVLEATELCVAPGFVDVHSHSDFTLLVDPRAQSAIAQGVTTELIGNCGHGCAPISDPELAKTNIYGYTPVERFDWSSMGEYLERLQLKRPAVNVATLVPNGNLRLAAVGLADRPAAATEVRYMAALLEESLDAGAFGLSTGLEYPAERTASPDEITALCRVVARRGGLYATHTRNRDVQAVESIAEAIAVAERAEVRLQVSHIIPRRAGDPGAWHRALELVDTTRARGLDIAFDSHTRLHGITNLSNALPPEEFALGPAELAARLTQPEARARIKRHRSLISSFGLGGWDRVFLFSSRRCPERVGKSFAELAPVGGDAIDAILDVLLAEVEDPHAVLCTCHSYEDEWLRATMRHPLGMPGSDATDLCLDGPLASATFLGAYTWAGWFFRRLVTETGDLSLEDAVRKLTSIPAQRIGLTDRGMIVEGACADLAVFDPARFCDRGTMTTPNRLADGVHHVIVNGTVALKNGSFTGHRGGSVLRSG